MGFKVSVDAILVTPGTRAVILGFAIGSSLTSLLKQQLILVGPLRVRRVGRERKG
jgi:hypothetical protein